MLVQLILYIFFDFSLQKKHDQQLLFFAHHCNNLLIKIQLIILMMVLAKIRMEKLKRRSRNSFSRLLDYK